MKAYIILQDIYGEGNFGDTELQNIIIHGVYSSKEKARNKMKKIPKSFHHASGLSMDKTENKVYIDEHEIDK